ncbi:MAG: aminotransferase class V-fold PLP-dependent enzyme [Rhizobiales bacterium]|nr:aminotransferase class V-fold PLP-dependent enzyme [Hyphomicrobiales bacterium]NRB14974.1 aminotransferase class V-fold PLP-dependent enzyme [Hyphomicrobiales bacterium]
MDKYSDLFPVSKQTVYLKNAAQAPLNARSERALLNYIQLESTDINARPSTREPIRALLAELLGGAPADYALTSSTGAGISLVAAGLSLQPGDNVVLPSGEHWNNSFPWLRLQEFGVEVRLVAPDQNNRVSIEAMAQQVDNKTRVVGTTAVRFDTGYRANLKALSKLAHSVDALLVVDGIQCAGANSLNVVDDGVDILACGGFKWLLGMAGTGFLYLNKRARARVRPLAPGMFAAAHNFETLTYHDDARQYETGSLAHALFHSWAEGLLLLNEIGIPAIQAKNFILTDRILSGFKNLPVQVLSPHQNQQERSAILAFTAGKININKAISEMLEQQNILLSFRGDSLRVSPNFYNTEAEIDRFLDALEHAFHQSE